MTKIFCDRCKKEITNDLIDHHFHISESNFIERTSYDICDDCYKTFESFMKMECSTCHTNPGSNHGIERMTFGSK